MRANIEGEGRIVSKFGGHAVAAPDRTERAIEIFMKDPRRSVMMTSGMGSLDKDVDEKNPYKQQKGTDMLIACYERVREGKSIEEPYTAFRERSIPFGRIVGNDSFIYHRLDQFEKLILDGAPMGVVYPMGELLQAEIVAAASGLTFVDAADVLKIDKHWNVDYTAIAASLPPGDKYIVPAWYGEQRYRMAGIIPKKERRVFSGRDGSDTTAAHVARGIDAILYENWKDVLGIYSANPKKVEKAKLIDTLSYAELEIIGITGDRPVVHSDAIGPVAEAKIPLNVRSTLFPEHMGTLIVDGLADPFPRRIAAVTRKDGFTAFRVEKQEISYERNVGEKLTKVLEKSGVDYQEITREPHAITIVIHQDHLKNGRKEIADKIERTLGSTDTTIFEMGYVTAVGEGIRDRNFRTEVIADFSQALRNSQVPTISFEARPGSIGVVVGVNKDDVARTVETAHDAFFG